jgi:aspartate carbamoyltransferase catalytic subunit
MSLQLDEHGRLRHLLTLEGLPREVLCGLLDRAQQLCGHAQDPARIRELLAGTAV